MRFICAFLLLASLGVHLQSCAGGSGGSASGVSGNTNGSDPINPSEENDYKRAILKCYKTGGSRVVKIEGRLMCY